MTSQDKKKRAMTSQKNPKMSENQLKKSNDKEKTAIKLDDNKPK